MSEEMSLRFAKCVCGVVFTAGQAEELCDLSGFVLYGYSLHIIVAAFLHIQQTHQGRHQRHISNNILRSRRQRLDGC